VQCELTALVQCELTALVRCELTARVLAHGLGLLGSRVPERM
jgi:hypothetical protein